MTNTYMITRAGGKLKPETIFASEKGYGVGGGRNGRETFYV